MPGDRNRRSQRLLGVCLSYWFMVFALFTTFVDAYQFYDTGSIPAPVAAEQLIYAPGYNMLVIRNSSTAIATINLGSQISSLHQSYSRFTDMSIAPGGRYVFVADYGGEDAFYRTPAAPSYVHRLDLLDNSWETKTAYIAGNVQAVSDSQFILKSMGSWVALTNNLWGTGVAVVPINTPTGHDGPGYAPLVRAGDFRFDASTGRLLHGAGAGSQEIHTFRFVGNDFFKQEGSGLYGSAAGHGGSVVLATDASAFYYGKLKVDVLDVSLNRTVFAEVIHAATNDIAFGDGKYYDARTGLYQGNLGFPTTVYGLNPNGLDFWAYNSTDAKLHHFAAIAAAPVSGPCTLLNNQAMLDVVGIDSGSAAAQVRAGTVEFNPAPGNAQISVDMEDSTIRMFNNTVVTDAQYDYPTTYTVTLDGSSPLSITGITVTVIGVTGFEPASVSFTTQSVAINVTGSTWHGGDSVKITLHTVCPPCTLDADGSDSVDATTDGLILLRAMFGMTGTSVTGGTVSAGATRQDWAAIRPYLNTVCGASFKP